MAKKITIYYDDPGLGPEGSIKDDAVAMLELVLPYMLDNVTVIAEPGDVDFDQAMSDHSMMIAGDTAD